MSTSIRPGGPVSSGISGIQGPNEASAPTSSGAVEATRSSDNVSAAAPEGATATVLSQLQAGELTRAQAIDSLVAQALVQHGGAGLPPTQRTELEQVLRAALLDDPAISALLG